MSTTWPHKTIQPARDARRPSARSVATGMGPLRRMGLAVGLLGGVSLLAGCMAQQADLKQVDRDLKQANLELQKRIKHSNELLVRTNEELAQTRARHSQEIINLRDELPALGGKLEEATHRAKLLQEKQEDLMVQQSRFDKRLSDSDKRLTDGEKKLSERLGWVEKQLVNQEQKMEAAHKETKTDITAAIKQLTDHIEGVQKNISEVVQKTTTTLAQKVDGRLDEQQKMIHAVENRSASVSQLDAQSKAMTDQVGRLNQALTDFRQVLNSLADKMGQQEQSAKQISTSVEQETAAIAKRTDALAAKIEADNKATSEHLNEVNRSVASVAKALEAAGGRFANRGDEQDRRLEEVSRDITYVQSQIQTLEKNMENQHTFLKQVEQHLQSLDKNYENHQVFLKQVEQHLASRPVSAPSSGSGVGLAEAATPPAPTIPPVSVTEPNRQSSSAAHHSGTPSAGAQAGTQGGSNRVASVTDREAYERILHRFKEGDLDSARQGFAEFLVQHPHSDFAPNARFWLGETYYGKKDYSRAIDAYDQVQLNHPGSEKVAAALLKKGYAYLALKDRRRAASTLKQVIDLYPRSPEANKAIDKLNQLKEQH